jgi:predicted metalloprotease
MKAYVLISVLLVLVCATARTATAGHATADDTRTIIAAVTADLSDYWRTTLGSRVLSYEGPRGIVFYRRPIDTPCGPTTMRNARYCPGDRTVYLDENWLDELLAGDDYTPIAILAHEWGHEVQDELGTLDRTSEHAYLRAIELQADCFAGLFTRSQQDAGRIDPSAIRQARTFFFSAGDASPKTRSHGTGPQRVAWFNAGYQSGDRTVCDSIFQKEHAVPRIPEE